MFVPSYHCTVSLWTTVGNKLSVDDPDYTEVPAAQLKPWLRIGTQEGSTFQEPLIRRFFIAPVEAPDWQSDLHANAVLMVERNMDYESFVILHHLQAVTDDEGEVIYWYVFGYSSRLVPPLDYTVSLNVDRGVG